MTYPTRRRRDSPPSEVSELFLATVSQLEAEGFRREDERASGLITPS